MRIMALDYGSKRIGVAVSDELRMIAHPLEFIPAHPPQKVIQRLQELIQEKNVSLILIGMPRNMDGSYGPAAEKTKAFIEGLGKEISVAIKTWDERLTTVQANRFLSNAKIRGSQRKEKVDQTAAAILLQSYLDSASS